MKISSEPSLLTIVLVMGVITTSAFGARPWWDDKELSRAPNSPRSSSPPAAWWENTRPPDNPSLPNWNISPFSERPLWRGPNGEMWGMFLFGGPPQIMDRWMDRMEYWGDRMEQWSERRPDQRSGNRSSPSNIFRDMADPWLDHWRDWSQDFKKNAIPVLPER